MHQQTAGEAEGRRCHVATPQEKTAATCGISLRTVLRVTSEGKKNNSVFKLPRKNPRRKKPITGLDDFKKNVLRKSIFNMYTKDEFSTSAKLTQKMKEAIGFNGSKDSILQILKNLDSFIKNVMTEGSS